MPTANPFRIPSVPRAPVAPMQRSLFGASMFNRRRRPPAQEGPFAPVTALGSEAGPGPGGTSPSPFRPPGPAPFTPTGGPPMPPERDEWTEEEAEYRELLASIIKMTPPGAPKGYRERRDKEGGSLKGQFEPDPNYWNAVAQLRAIQTARLGLQRGERRERRQEAPFTEFFQRPFGGFAQGRYSQQRDPQTGANVGPETFLGGEKDPAAIARDIAQQRANAPVSEDSVRQNPLTGKWERVRQSRNPLTGEIAETVLGEAAPPLAFQQFQFTQAQAAQNRKEAIDKAVNEELQKRMQVFTAQTAANQPQLYGQPRQGDPALAQNMLNAQQANNQVMAARTRQALYPAAQNAIKLLQGNPQALRDDQKAALLRDFAPLFEAGVEEAQGLDLGVLWAALQPLRGFGFARQSPAIFAGRR